MYPIIGLIVLMLCTWIIVMWASYGESNESRSEEKLEQSSDQQGYCQAALKQGSGRQTTSSRLQLERSCIMCKKTCRRTYVFQTTDGGSYEL